MTEEIFSRALQAFETLPGDGLMQHSIAILARGGIEERRIRNWCKSVAEQYGITDYVGPDFERRIMDVGLRLAREEMQADVRDDHSIRAVGAGSEARTNNDRAV